MLAAGFFINLGATPSNIFPYFKSFNNYTGMEVSLTWKILAFNFDFDACFLVLMIYRGWVDKVAIRPAPIPETNEFKPNYFPLQYKA